MEPRVTLDQAILQSLELCVAAGGDPAPEIYRRFFAKYPDAESMFGDDADNHVRYRMMDGIFSLILELANGGLQPRHATYWVTDHVAWEVDHAMMQDMFAIIVATIRDMVGVQWTEDFESAWQSLVASIMPAIQQMYGDAASHTVVDGAH